MSPSSTQEQVNQVVAAAVSLMVVGMAGTFMARMARRMWAPERPELHMLPQTRRYGDRVAISKGLGTREEAVEWTQKRLAIFSAELRPHRVARVWYSQPYQAWFGAIYIKEVSNRLDYLPARAMQREEIRALDLGVSPDDYTEALWISSREDAWGMYKANYIDLSTLDRIEGSLAMARYQYPPGTRIAIALLYHKDRYWTLLTRIFVPTPETEVH